MPVSLDQSDHLLEVTGTYQRRKKIGDRMNAQQRRFHNLQLWQNAMKFHLDYYGDLFPLYPLLFIPVWTDCFHSVVIRQAISSDRKIRPFAAIAETTRLFPSLLITKFRLVFIAGLWGILPIIGWYKGSRYRLKWAMVSNVQVFEKLHDKSRQERYERLADLVSINKRSNSLIVIPAILVYLVLTFIMFTTMAVNSSLFFWVGGFVAAWIIFPVSATVNTLVYLSVTRPKVFEALISGNN